MEKIAVAVLWHGMSLNEKSAACVEAVSEPMSGQVRDSALYHLCREAFHSSLGHPNKEATIKASVLRERLPGALKIWHDNFVKSTDDYANEIIMLREELAALVRLCERKERELGRPCTLNMFFKLYQSPFREAER